MKALRRWRGHTADGGAAAVEFALVMPVLILLVFGIIDFGALFAQQIALNNAVRQGARGAVVAGATGTQTCSQIVTGTQSAASPTVGMNTSAIRVQSSLVQTNDSGGAALFTCPGGFTATSSDTTVACQAYGTNPSTGNSLKVEARYQASFLVPLPIPISAPTLSATAVYICEFT